MKIGLDKETLGIISIVLVLLGYAPYFYSILKRRTNPHMFTWVTWSLINIITCAGQLTSGAGAGSWGFGASSALCLVVVGLGFAFGETLITRGDKIVFCAALAAIPLWYFTKDPLGALMLVTLINIFGAYPTFRKSYVDPLGENLLAWSIHGPRSFIVLFAVERYSLVTMIAPLAALFINGGIPLILVWRRREIKDEPIM
jgi:hypothetical protein